MTDISKQKVEAVLQAYVDPYLQKDLMSSKVVKKIDIDGNKVKINIVFGFPCAGYQDVLIKHLSSKLQAIEGIDSVEINIGHAIVSHAVQRGVSPIKGVKNVIAIASGKGGVGKSTVSVNVALALSAEGANVGLLDADIYGPSQPRMLGCAKDKPESEDGISFEPVTRYDLQTMSIGYLVEEDTPMIWRGPMVTQALEQLLRNTHWRDLDYLIIDLPPGTGDTQLTLAQKIPVSGAVIITTPQDIALLDARKGLKMFEKVNVPILGIVENMSIHICGQCGHEEYVFGEGGGLKMSQEMNVDFLGGLPLDMQIRKDTDEGHPTVIHDPESRIAEMYREITRRLTAKLSLQSKDYSTKFPSIKVENN